MCFWILIVYSVILTNLHVIIMKKIDIIFKHTNLKYFFPDMALLPVGCPWIGPPQPFVPVPYNPYHPTYNNPYDQNYRNYLNYPYYPNYPYDPNYPNYPNYPYYPSYPYYPYQPMKPHIVIDGSNVAMS